MIRPDFQRATAISFAAHLFIFITALIINSFGHSTKHRTYTVSLIAPETRSITRTEGKALKKPIRRTPPAKKMPVKKEPVNRTPSAKKKPQMAVKRDISPIVAIDATDKAIEKIRKEKQAKEAEAHAAQMLKEMEKKKRLEEIRNQSAALGASGIGSTLSQDKRNAIIRRYSDSVMTSIKENWVFPEVGTAIHTEVMVTIFADGSIRVNKTNPSPNRAFDQSVIKAIVKTGKVEPPPFGSNLDVILNFIPAK